MMNPQKAAILQRLQQLVAELYGECGQLSTEDEDLQRWYNRGYADGMVKALASLGYARELADLTPVEPLSLSDAERFLPWGKAHTHGFEMGEKETLDVLGDA
jgi:hypothetical protein